MPGQCSARYDMIDSVVECSRNSAHTGQHYGTTDFFGTKLKTYWKDGEDYSYHE